MESLMDYIDEIEEILDSSKNVPFSNKVSVDRERVFEVIAEIRMNLPNEIRQAQKIITEHDKIVNEAKNKAQSIIREGETTVERMTAEHEIYKKAVEKGNELIEQSKRTAQEIHINAYKYADDLLEKAELMVREYLIVLEKKHREVDDYLNSTVDMLYENRQQLRG